MHGVLMRMSSNLVNTAQSAQSRAGKQSSDNRVETETDAFSL